MNTEETDLRQAVDSTLSFEELPCRWVPLSATPPLPPAPSHARSPTLASRSPARRVGPARPRQWTGARLPSSREAVSSPPQAPLPSTPPLSISLRSIPPPLGLYIGTCEKVENAFLLLDIIDDVLCLSVWHTRLDLNPRSQPNGYPLETPDLTDTYARTMSQLTRLCLPRPRPAS